MLELSMDNETNKPTRDQLSSNSSELPAVGVRRLILLDSFLQGTRNQLEIDGHISITGRNGSGKTSLIRLFSLFFGAEPQHLTKQDNRSNTLSFSDYYLPRNGSYIVFEYDTNQGRNLAVFITDSRGDRIRPILMSDGYEPSLFIDNSDRFLPREDLIRRARAAGRDVYDAESLNNYKAIVLGSARERPNRVDLFRFNVIAGFDGQYRRSMTDVYSLLIATLQKDQSIDERQLQRLMLRIAQREGNMSIDNLKGTGLTPDEIQTWIDRYRGLVVARSLRENAAKAIEQSRHLVSARHEQVVLLQAAERKHQTLNQELADCEQQLNTYHDQKNELARQRQAQYNKHTTESSEIRRAKESAKVQLDALENQESEYRNNGITETLRIADELDERYSRSLDADEELSRLKSQSSDIQAEYDRGEREAVARKNAAFESVETKARAKQSKIDADIESLEEQQREAREMLESNWEDRRQVLQEAVDQANARVARLKSEYDSIGPDPELIKERDAKRQERDRLESERDQAYEYWERKSRALQGAKDEQERINGEFLSEDNQQRARQTEYEQLDEKLARDNTLLGFIRNKIPEAESDIGATLNAGRELLYDNRLSPQLAETGHSGLFGVDIDTARLDAIAIDQEDRDYLKSLKQAIDTGSQKITALRKSLNSAKQKVTDLQKQNDQAEGDYKQARSRYGHVKERLEGFDERLRASREERRSERAKSYNAAVEAHNSAKADLESEKKDFKQNKKNLDGEYNQQIRDLRGDKQRIEDKIQTDKDRIKKACDSRIERLATIRSQKLSEKGVDPEVVQKAESEAEVAHKQLAEARTAKSKADQYEAFRNDYNARKPGLQQQISTNEQKLRELENNWRSIERDFNKSAQELDGQIKQLEHRRAKSETARDRIDRLLNSCEAQPNDDAIPDETMVSHYAAGEADDLISAHREAEQNEQQALPATCGPLRNVAWHFMNSQNSAIVEFSKKHQLDSLAYSGDVTDISEATAVLVYFFGEHPVEDADEEGNFPVHSAGDDFESNLRRPNFGDAVTGYMEILSALKREVSKQSTHLSKHCQDIVNHLGGFDKVEIDASFNFSQLPSYEAMRDLRDAVHEDQEKQKDVARFLPNQRMADAAERYLEHLRYQPSFDSEGLSQAIDLKFITRRPKDYEDQTFKRGQAVNAGLSNGEGTMVSAILLIAFLESSRGGLPIRVPWMLDELLNLDEQNASGLFEALRQLRICLVTGSPNVTKTLDRYFDRRYTLRNINREGDQQRSVLMEVRPQAPNSSNRTDAETLVATEPS